MKKKFVTLVSLLVFVLGSVPGMEPAYSSNLPTLEDYAVSEYDWLYIEEEVLTTGTLIPNGGFEEVAEEDLGCWYGWYGGTCNTGCYGQCRGICVRSLAGWTIGTCYGGVYKDESEAPEGSQYLSGCSFPSDTDTYTSPIFTIEDEVSFIAKFGGCGKVSVEIKPDGGSWIEIIRFRDLGSPPGSEDFCSSAHCDTCGTECNDDGAIGSIPWTTFIIDTSTWKGQEGQIRFKNTRCPSWCCGTGLSVDNVRTHTVEPELLAYWKFDEGSGSIASDSSGYGKDGSIYGATWTTGKIGNALNFDGSNDWVDVPDDISPEHITLEAWIYPTGVYDIGDQGSPIITKETGRGTPPWSESFAWRLRITPYTHKLQLQCFTPTGVGGGSAVSDTELQMGRWYHVAGTYDGTETKVYINGNLEGSYTAPINEPLVTSTLPTGIGHLPNWSVQWFEGIIDEVQVYGTALTPEEIAEHAAAGEPVVTLDVDAPDEAWMCYPYRINVEVGALESFPGGLTSIVVSENRGPIHVTWDIHDNEYWDFWGGEWRERPDAKWTVYVYDDVLDRWIVEDDDYEFGIEDIPVNLSPGETAYYYLEGYHRWYWIEPWDWDRVADILLGMGSGFLDKIISGSINAGLIGKQVCEAFGGQHEITYAYTAICEGAQDNDSTTVKVPIEKYILLGESMILHAEAVIASTLGGPIGWVIEAGSIIVAEGAYVVASDPPDFNYTEVAVPQIPEIAALSQIDDPNQLEASKKAVELAAVSIALRISMERYDGAKIDRRPEYMALQLEASRFYAGKILELINWLSDYWGPISENLPIPTPQEIQQIREDLEQNGLPDLEVAILSSFGYTAEEMTEIAHTIAALPDEYYTSPEKIRDALDIIVDAATEYIQYIPETPSEVVLVELSLDPDVFNRKSKGMWVTCYIELPEGYDVSEIDVDSLMLQSSVSAESEPTEIDDYDEDGIPDLMIKFDRQELIDLLETGEQILALTGQLTDGTPLAGIDVIRVIH